MPFTLDQIKARTNPETFTSIKVKGTPEDVERILKDEKPVQKSQRKEKKKDKFDVWFRRITMLTIFLGIVSLIIILLAKLIDILF